VSLLFLSHHVNKLVLHVLYLSTHLHIRHHTSVYWQCNTLCELEVVHETKRRGMFCTKIHEQTVSLHSTRGWCQQIGIGVSSSVEYFHRRRHVLIVIIKCEYCCTVDHLFLPSALSYLFFFIPVSWTHPLLLLLVASLFSSTYVLPRADRMYHRPGVVVVLCGLSRH